MIYLRQHTTLLLSFLQLVILILISSKMNIRKAIVKDLPCIHNLIRQSYLAMLEHTGEDMRERWEKGAQESINTDLSSENFEKMYMTNYGNNFFVAETEDNKVVGCVAIKRTSQDEAELIRMAVDPNIRSTGIGGSLINNLLAYAKNTGVLRISLVTANPLAAKFYTKNKFATFHEFRYPFAENKFLTVFKMIYYFGEKIIRNVTVIGGTHGNERIGVELIRLWEANSNLMLKRDTIDVKCLIGNTDAVMCNKRYVDADLNRQFLSTDLSKELQEDDKLEVKRAKELNQILGPKGRTDMNCASDFLIDLHSSNSNVGIVCMISGESDVIALRTAAKLKNYFPEMKITCSMGNKDASWSVDSVTENGLSLEVGPLAHGTLNFNLLEKTKSMVTQILDDLNQRNSILIKGGGVTNSFGRDVAWADISSESSSISPIDNFISLEIFTPVQRVTYPDTEEKYLIHPDIEGKDWHPLKLADKVMISIDGQKILSLSDLVNIKDAKENDEFFPLFINEAAYVESKVAFAIYSKKNKVIP